MIKNDYPLISFCIFEDLKMEMNVLQETLNLRLNRSDKILK
jgi:hypothetical protein